MLSMLGIARHGQRIISQNSGDKIALRKVFWSLFVVHLAVSVFFTGLYLVFIYFFVKENVVIYVIHIFYVLSALFDITWLFYGLENFKSVVIKNAFVKIAECVLVFALVRTPADLPIYALINTGSLFLGQVVMIPQAIKTVKPIRFSIEDAKQHIKPLLVFSISVIAASLYTIFDKTLLGLLSSKENVAFYEYSNKIITVPVTIIGVVGTVMFPRACKLANEGDVDGQKRYINYSYILTSFIGMGSIFGLLSIGSQFAICYYGDSFAVCGNVIMALSPLVLIIGIGDIIRTQYMIPNHMDKQFNICILLNAAVNIILSLSLIPVIGIYGAVIGTISAEIFGIVYQLILCKKFIKIKDIMKEIIPFSFIGLIMFALIKCLQLLGEMGLRMLLIEVVVGGSMYLLLSVLYFRFFKRNLWDELVCRLTHRSK